MKESRKELEEFGDTESLKRMSELSSLLDEIEFEGIDKKSLDKGVNEESSWVGLVNIEYLDDFIYGRRILDEIKEGLILSVRSEIKKLIDKYGSVRQYGGSIIVEYDNKACTILLKLSIK